VPAFYFVFRHRDMHQLFSPKARMIIVAVSTIAVALFCLRNAVWDLPVIDFRPFKTGTDLYQKKTAEEEAAAAVQVLALKLKNKHTGEIREVSMETYKTDWAKYPKEEWETIEQIKSELAIEPTKVSEFSLISADGFDVAEDILTDSGHVFLIVAYKLKGETGTQEVTLQDTTWVMDTVSFSKDSAVVVKSIDTIVTRTGIMEVYQWDPAYVKKYTDKVNPLMEEVMKQGAKVYAAAGGAGTEKLDSFKQATGATYDWYEADDILLKTIIRSNPGVVHIRGGKVIDMWHIRHLPGSLPLN
jgi:hypothetical protein